MLSFCSRVGRSYHLGTQHGGAYKNPADSNLVKVTASSVESSSAPPNVLLSRDQSVRFQTKNSSRSWVAFEFPGRIIIPRRYTLVCALL